MVTGFAREDRSARSEVPPGTWITREPWVSRDDTSSSTPRPVESASAGTEPSVNACVSGSPSVVARGLSATEERDGERCGRSPKHPRPR